MHFCGEMWPVTSVFHAFFAKSYSIFLIITEITKGEAKRRGYAMQVSHIFSRRSIDLCDAPSYLNIRQDWETLAHLVSPPLKRVAEMGRTNGEDTWVSPSFASTSVPATCTGT